MSKSPSGFVVYQLADSLDWHFTGLALHRVGISPIRLFATRMTSQSAPVVQNSAAGRLFSHSCASIATAIIFQSRLLYALTGAAQSTLNLLLLSLRLTSPCPSLVLFGFPTVHFFEATSFTKTMASQIPKIEDTMEEKKDFDVKSLTAQDDNHKIVVGIDLGTTSSGVSNLSEHA